MKRFVRCVLLVVSCVILKTTNNQQLTTPKPMPRKVLSAIVLTLLLITLNIGLTYGQARESVFRMAEGFVRIAEPGQLADTLTVWGDISAPGRYIVPRGTKPHELISYARGPANRLYGGGNEVALDWSKLRLEISISTYHPERGEETVQSYEFRYSDPFPSDLREYRLRNDQIISLEVKRRPSFVDYLRVLGPVLSVTTTTILLIDRLQN